MTILYFFLLLWAFFALLDPDPATQINADPGSTTLATLVPVPENEFVRIYAGGGGADSEVAVERAVVEGGHGGHQAAHEGVLGAEAARLGRQQRILSLQAVAFLLQLHVLGSVSQQRPFVVGSFWVLVRYLRGSKKRQKNKTSPAHYFW
jgi:hypothetical protein